MISIIEAVQKIKIFRNSIAHMNKGDLSNAKSNLPKSSTINTMRKDLSKKYAPKPFRFRTLPRIKTVTPSYPTRIH